MKRRIVFPVVLLALIAASFAAVVLVKRGKTARPFEGYTLFAPLSSNVTYLINNDGNVVHEWQSDAFPGNSVYLLENGHLLRTADPGANGNETFTAGGAGGRVDEYDWEGNLVWQFEYSSPRYLQHHDIERMPNGNILMIAWEHKSAEEAVAAGRDPKLLKDGELWPDSIIEVKPTGPRGGEVVWEWHLWDHLIQDFDPSKANYGDVGQHPELVDINFVGQRTSNSGKADWTHTNAVDYNAELDQIVLSIHGFSEIWVINHSTTAQEAAGHNGGRQGKGGDLLYRWGNPQAYRAGSAEDRQLFGQHDSEWIEKGLPGQDHILIFNNGLNRPVEGKPYSTIVEIVTPVDAAGNYALSADGRYDPVEPVWTYRAERSESFYSAYISGAQRLPNGNTLVCSGGNGELFEVTPKREVVWRYTNQFTQAKPKEGPVKGTAVFRADRYAPNYPGFEGSDLPQD